MTVKSLLVKIGADVSEFDRATKDIDNKTKAIGASLQRVGAGLTAVGAVITGTVGMMIKSYIQAGDEVHEMALRTGFSTTALSELGYAAKICGTDIGDVEVGVKKMSSSLFDATMAGDQAGNAFTRIGLSTQDLIKLSPEQQFDKIAKALAAVENPTIRAATAVDIFGRSGTKLLPLFKEGPAGMEALRKKAHELGIVFDQEAADKADALNDAITTLKSSFAGIGNAVAGTLIPAITGLVGKITGAIVKVKEWITAHPGLSSAIFKVVTAMGLLMAAIGPVLIVLPTLVASLKMLGLAQMALLGPIGLVTAALAGLAVGYLAVKDAQNKTVDEAGAAWDNLSKKLGGFSGVATAVTAQIRRIGQYSKESMDEATGLGEKLWASFNEVGERATLAAIATGKFGADAQKAFTVVGGETLKFAESLETAKGKADEIGKAYEMAMLQASEAAKAQAEAIITTRRQLTDEIQKGMLKEYDYQKWALSAAYDERKTQIAKEVTDEKAKGLLLLQAKQSYNAQLTALEKSFRDKELQGKIDFGKQIKEQEQQMDLDRIEALKTYAAQRQAIQNGINQMTMTALQYKLLMLDQERVAEEARIASSTALSAQQKAELLALLAAYYAQRRALGDADATAEVTLAEATQAALTGVYASFLNNVLGAFQAFGEGTKTILGAVGSAFKGTINACIQALKQLIVQELVAAAATILLEKSKSIARVITSVMALPFPLNLLAVGGAIAAVSALFSAIKLGEGGVVMGPTLALVGDVPEAVIPLNKLGLLTGGDSGGREGPSFTLNINSPLIQTTGLSRGQVDELAPYLFNAVEGEARRWGFSLKRG